MDIYFHILLIYGPLRMYINQIMIVKPGLNVHQKTTYNYFHPLTFIFLVVGIVWRPLYIMHHM